MLLKYLIILCMAVGVAVSSCAGESYVLVPQTLDEIANVNFRQALSDRAPDYDSLGRQNQVFYFIQAYKSLNNGQDPALTDADAWHVGLPGGLPPSAPPHTYPRYSAERYAYFPGYGYHRLPPFQPLSPSEAGQYIPYGYGADDYELPPNIRHRAVPRRVEPVHVDPLRVEPIRVEPEQVRPAHVEPRHVEPVDARY